MLRSIMLRSAVLALLSCFAGSVFAAQPQADIPSGKPIDGAGDTILVFDASGSMWGQIDGVAKISIARDVVQGLLKDLPVEQRMGLVAYGHRRKGDCKDIQTLVNVGTDRTAISEAIAGIDPKGMTPMTAAVEHAADELKFTEKKATVILVSDGKETCKADPCAVAAKLEKLGIGLTVHTIGFGLGDKQAGAKDQLRCMAQATGGRFLQADDATELRDALSQVSVDKPTPEPQAAPVVETVEATLKATDQQGGPLIKTGLIWTVRHGATGKVIFTSDETGTARPELPRGVHDVSVLRVSDGATAEGQIDAGGSARLTLPIVVELVASVKAPDSAAAGSKIRVTWMGPDEKDDYIAVAKPGSPDNTYENFTYTARGNPLELLLPPASGGYEIRYVSNKTRTVLARQAIKVTDIQASLESPATAVAGSTVEVDWTGPDYKNDYIAIAKVGAAHNSYVNFTYTRKGKPLQLLMPAEAGDYEVRYIQDQGRTVLVREPITVTAVQASVEAPATAAAGSTVEVDWTGPDYKNDSIAIAKVGAAHNSYVNFTYTRKGKPLQLLMPAEAGDYEVRYIQDQGRTVLVREPITVTGVQASVEAPATAAAGSTVEVDWTGPDYKNDSIAIAKVGAAHNSYVNFTYTRKGKPLQLLMPAEAGDYEVRYIQDQGRTVLVRDPITVTAVQASVEAPATAEAGSTVEVDWTGPDYKNDSIAIAKVGAAHNSYVNFTYTRKGKPLQLLMPAEAGDYEVRYIQDQGRTVLARKAITVSP